MPETRDRVVPVRRTVASLLIAGVFVVPLVFSTAYDDVFVRPKLVALWVVVGLATGVMLIGSLRTGTLPSIVTALADWLVLGFLTLNALALYFSFDRAQSFIGEPLQYQGFLTLLLYVGLYFLARLSLRGERSLLALFGAATTGGVLVAGYALVQRAGLDPVWDVIPHGRVFSSVGQANALAAYLVLVVPLAIALATRLRRAGRAVVGVGVAVMVGAVAFTFSRGGYAGLLVAGLVLAIPALGAVRRSGRRVTVVAAGSLLVAAVLISGVGPIRDTATLVGTRALSSVDIDEPGSIRMHLDKWLVATQIAADYPFLGAGQETYPDLFPAYGHAYLPADRAAAFDYYRVESPHNVYLATAAGAGWPAMAVQLATIVVIGLALIRTISAGDGTRQWLLIGLLAALGAHVATDFFMTAEPTGSALFWILLGAAVTQTRAVAESADSAVPAAVG